MSFRTTGYNYNSTDIGSFFCDLSNNQTVRGTKTFVDLPVDASSNSFATRSWVTANTPSTSTTVTTTSLATTLESYATTAALASYATTTALASYATTTALASYALTTSLASYALTSSVPVRAPYFLTSIAPGVSYAPPDYAVYLCVCQSPWHDRNSTRTTFVTFTTSVNGGPGVFDLHRGSTNTDLSFDNGKISTGSSNPGNCDVYYFAKC